MSTRRALYFTAPKQVEIREEELPPLKDDEVLVETLCSAVSAGTEMLLYRGQCPQVEDANDSISSELQYPAPYGYACVGAVKKAGKSVNSDWKDRLVFAFHPHASSFIVHPSSLLTVPRFVAPESACFFPNMETAVNLVQDGAPILGERVLVLGLGIVGLLTAALLSEFPLAALETRDLHPSRKRAFERWREGRLESSKVKELEGPKVGSSEIRALRSSKDIFALSDYTQNKFDLVFELSGSPTALNDAIRMTKFSGRVVIGSWYGEKRALINLGGEFHRSRIKLISSQVSSISPELSGRWDKQRRAGIVWDALARIRPEAWITHRFPIECAAEAYQLLDERPEQALQVLFEYSNVV